MVMRISKNFTLKELIHSNTAVKHGIKNTPNETELENLVSLVKNLLQPLRDIYGKPFYIGSGFRNQEVNKLVGGVPTSQHTKGESVDVTPDGRDPRKLLQLLINSKLDWDQAILYDNGKNCFLHLSYTTSKPNRKQVLYSKGTTPL